MRISDWSSDVCSSDLVAALGEARHQVDGCSHPVLDRAGGVPHHREVLVVPRDAPVAKGVEEELHGTTDGARVGLAGQHDGAVGGVIDELLDLAGLADPGLPRHERDRKRTRLKSSPLCAYRMQVAA